MSGSPRIPAAPAPAAPPPPPAMATDQAAPSSLLWSDGLPPEFAGLVIRRLPSLADRTRFGAVCRRWGLAAQQQAPTLPAPLPWISNFFTQVFQSFPDGEPHELQRHSRFLACRGLSESWLMFVRPGSCAQSSSSCARMMTLSSSWPEDALILLLSVH
ncbi:uncharacterized protein LOC104585184 isoform X2 [Brachypodium distachyon]|uniref:uncharacterized protein LOC104585184 isoform X2 n=1 Tax=Brachypodium distachyon TaxID=15368 RepID=UPI000D0DFE99|nr:uncharacterized protein LOC104585184 isoform X2 [Brachypodium distachyon]|eukprot:XP_024310730.1 uncharacterized protein LOC104585184 isoform X2 [Brachypodium distachyon]